MDIRLDLDREVKPHVVCGTSLCKTNNDEGLYAGHKIPHSIDNISVPLIYTCDRI